MKYFLGMEVARSSYAIMVFHQKYIVDFLDVTGCSGSQPANTPIEADHKLSMHKEEECADIGTYQQLLERLIYFIHAQPEGHNRAGANLQMTR